MKVLSKVGFELLQQFEGCKLTAYEDSGGLPTIGYGHIRNVKMGDKITQGQADGMLIEDLVRYLDCVNRSVLVPINQNQFDALVCFTFNLGCGSLKSSTLLKKLNALDYVEAGNQFLRWNKVKGRRVQGLANRREAERRLFLGETPTPKIPKPQVQAKATEYKMGKPTKK